MIPEIKLHGSVVYGFICKSAIPIEEAERAVKINGGLSLVDSNSCHHYCKNHECDYKKNITKLQKEYFHNCRCTFCDRKVEWGYFLIIRRLKREDLLEKKFVPVCCWCYDRERKGA